MITNSKGKMKDMSTAIPGKLKLNQPVFQFRNQRTFFHKGKDNKCFQLWGRIVSVPVINSPTVPQQQP